MPSLFELHDDAIAMLEAGRSHEAASSFRRVARLAASEPEHAAAAYFNLGIAMKDLSRQHDAATAYLAALELQPVFPQAHFNLARAFQMLADDEGRAGYLRRPRHERRELLLRAAHHFRRAESLGPSAQRTTASAAQHLKSLEEVLWQLGSDAAASRSYVEYVRRAPNEGMRHREKVSCERILAWLRHESEKRPGALNDAIHPPPRSLCSVQFADSATRSTMRIKQHFEARGYSTLPLLLQRDARSYVARHYASLARRSTATSGFYRDEPSAHDREMDSILAKGRWAVDNEPLSLFLADALAPVVQNVSGVPVRPAFTKVAWYTPNSKLPPHRDQVQNLVSVSLVIDASDELAAAEWPLRLVAAPSASGNNHEADLRLESGGALVFLGRDFVHHRPCCLEQGRHALVILFHYVPQTFATVDCALRLLDHGATIHHECTAKAGGVDASTRPGGDAKDDAKVMRGHASTVDDEGSCVADHAHGSVDGSTDGGYEGYMLYSPCTVQSGSDYCMGQFNNQLHMLHHALAVARSLRRILVVPPFLWMANQDAPRQQWFKASHFLDTCSMDRRQPVVELHDFAARLRRLNMSIPQVLSPPYILPEHDTTFSGAFFARRACA